MGAVDADDRIGDETIEAGLHTDGIGSHQTELDPVAFLNIVRQMERQLQHIEAVAGRSENPERLEMTGKRLSAPAFLAADGTDRRIEIAVSDFRQTAVNAVIDIKIVALAQMNLRQHRAAIGDQRTARLAHQRHGAGLSSP